MTTTATRKQTTKRSTKTKQLVWIIIRWDSFDDLGYAAFQDGTPRVYVRDQLDDRCGDLPYVGDFNAVCKRFHQRDGVPCEGGGDQTPIQVPVQMLAKFGFSERDQRRCKSLNV